MEHMNLEKSHSVRESCRHITIDVTDVDVVDTYE